MLHITIRRLIRQSTDGTCTEGLPGAEDNLRIFVRLGLILSGEIQINIRLLISLKAQEGFKGNIKTVLV